MSTTRFRSICDLPNELKLNITELLYESGSTISKGLYGAIPGDILIPLSRVNRDWRYMTLPYVFKEINFFEETNEAIAGFYRMVAPKYGHYCRSLGICLQPDPITLLGGSDEVKTVQKSTSSSPWTWQVKRNTLLFAILHFMPNLEHVGIAINDCPWHCNFPPCECLNAYEILMESLAARALKSIYFNFGFAYSSQNGSVDVATKLLLGTQESVESVHLFHCYDQDIGGYFTVIDILDILEDLPRLRDLQLTGGCSFTDLADRTWRSQLQTLHIDAEPYRGRDDEYIAELDGIINAAFEYLPDTLRHLNLGRWEYTDSFDPLSSAFPPHLALLERLTLTFPVTRAALTCFRASKVVTLELMREFDPLVLARFLGDNTTFPCLRTLFVWWPAGRSKADTPTKDAAKELLRGACKARDVTITFGPY